MAVAAVLCFLPVMVNTLRGLQSAKPAPDRADALLRGERARRSGGACASRRRCRSSSRRSKVASVLAMIGAIVGEYFGGALNALGVLINSDASVFHFETAWAGILVASLLGIALYVAVVAVGAARRALGAAAEGLVIADGGA